MTADPLFVLASLILAHVAADFVFQTSWMATVKFGRGRVAWTALLLHVVLVGLVLVPVPLAFGAPGLAFLVVSAASHLVIDRLKIVLTNRLAARSSTDLGPAWTPVPSGLFVVDQLAHLAVLVVAWATLLASAPVLPEASRLLDAILGPSDRALVGRWALAAVVGATVVIVNVRAASLFISVLVRAPRSARVARPAGDATAPRAPAAAETAAASPAGWSIRLGPLSGRIEPDRPVATEVSIGVGEDRRADGPAPPARVGEAIGILERLLIVALVLAGALEGVGLVIAAKAVARFKQLDDREFAEYFLLGTLASVTIAVSTALLAQAVLASTAP